MNWTSFRKDKGIVIITIVSLSWIIFLIIMGCFASRDVTFYEVISQTDVTSQYTSTLPLTRYLFEPFSGIAFFMGEGYEIILTMIIIYAIIRVIYIIIRKINLIKSEKFEVLVLILRDYSLFIFKVFIFIVIGVAIFLGIGFAIYGFLFINDFWMLAILTGMTIGFTLIIVKLAIIILKYYHPKMKLKIEAEQIPKHPIKKVLKITGIEARYLAIFLLLFIGSNFLLLSTPVPTHQITTTLAEDEFLFDFHVHTYFSDAYLSPEERVQWYIAQGIDGAAFTDHENQRGYQRAIDYVNRKGLNFIVLRGEEYTYHSLDIHLNYFGINETIVPPDKDPSFGSIQLNVSDMIRYVKDRGGWVFVNHYSGPPGTPYTYENLSAWGVDGFEVINGGHQQALQIRQFCLDNNLTCIAGSDIHTNEELNTVIKLRLEDPTNLTDASIFENLARNDHEAILIRLYPNKINFPISSDIFEVFEDFFNYLLNVNFFQILSWIIWSCIGYSLLIIVYTRIKRANLKKIRDKIEIID
ncbi:MAG TPA: PHP domain-containing protein [Candidatus Deferrimicrobium sp.]|nr:PHP domain-containing protein [Candidatus Deferrimicrobium sp.]